MTKEEIIMIDHSNRIENVHDKDSLCEALEAWIYQKGRKITLESILETHRLVMRRLRPDIAGKLRDIDIWIGGRRKRFISQSLYKEDIKALCNNLEVGDQLSADAHTRKCHVKFEHIHPFADGNGRVGRIVYNTHRLNLGRPIHVIHEGEEQMEYYKWFR